MTNDRFSPEELRKLIEEKILDGRPFTLSISYPGNPGKELTVYIIKEKVLKTDYPELYC